MQSRGAGPSGSTGTLLRRMCESLKHHRPFQCVGALGRIGTMVRRVCGSLEPHRHLSVSDVREPRAASAPSPFQTHECHLGVVISSDPRGCPGQCPCPSHALAPVPPIVG
ncbi:hypothetical protein J1N35_046107 [Gossypium stocksii]|uniref:Uncharacterized protein n=1 Tax=Gossypium stocksii TaxID=47602 RepID=A0A9D3U5H0_9ROSI|nr:hypothetical protein J1N35_046107 [Gossypium stocksii]